MIEALSHLRDDHLLRRPRVVRTEAEVVFDLARGTTRSVSAAQPLPWGMGAPGRVHRPMKGWATRAGFNLRSGGAMNTRGVGG